MFDDRHGRSRDHRPARDQHHHAAISGPLDVYGANMTLQVNFQDEINSTPAIGRASVGNKKLINLARGRALTNAVPPNELLAMVLPCDGSHPPRIVVLDKTSTNVLATVATLVDGEEAAAPAALSPSACLK